MTNKKKRRGQQKGGSWGIVEKLVDKYLKQSGNVQPDNNKD